MYEINEMENINIASIILIFAMVVKFLLKINVLSTCKQL
ncbi:hypothetical protein CLOBL_06740 [Clostridium sp. BL-8]|nr:hypothetical protein CLOBL_06740 [Clostridium sp. BL-8]